MILTPIQKNNIQETLKDFINVLNMEYECIFKKSYINKFNFMDLERSLLSNNKIKKKSKYYLSAIVNDLNEHDKMYRCNIESYTNVKKLINHIKKFNTNDNYLYFVCIFQIFPHYIINALHLYLFLLLLLLL